MNTFKNSNATSWPAQPHCEVYGWKARKEMTNKKLTLATEKVASNKDNDVQIGILYLHHILERLKVTEENNSWNKIAIHMCIKTWKITIVFDSTLMSKSWGQKCFGVAFDSLLPNQFRGLFFISIKNSNFSYFLLVKWRVFENANATSKIFWPHHCELLCQSRRYSYEWCRNHNVMFLPEYFSLISFNLKCCVGF